MKVFLPLFLIVFSLTAFGSRFGNGEGRRNREQKKKSFDWPGHYQCEQCTGSSPSSPTGSPVPSPAGCWKYDITILKYESERRALVEVHGPDGELGVKAKVSAQGEGMVEIHYTENLDTSTLPVSFVKEDPLLSLQHRDDDIILRFRKLSSKVSGQTAITCQRLP